jgi:protein TonB
VAAYPGGISALMEFLRRTVAYPASARRLGIEGTVYVSLVVEKNGEITELDIIKGISPDCDAECLRVVEAFPNWEPAIQRGKPVKSRFALPIKFTLAQKKVANAHINLNTFHLGIGFP